MPININKSSASSGISTPITVNGKTGTNITLSKSDIGLSSVLNKEQVAKDEVGVLVPEIQANGKILVEQTPIVAANLVSVANLTERLALPSNPNLTICLQADTQWMWSLNANEDPSIESNYIDCGSTSAAVISINEATGAVTITCANIGAVPVNRTINNKALSDNIILTISDIITLPNDSTKFLSGDGNWITPAGTLAGTNGQIQFNDNGASGADSNLVWDNTNKRLGIGASTPSTELHVHSTKTTTPVELSLLNNFVGQNGSGDDYEISTISLGDFAFNSSISTKIPNGAWGDGCRLDFATPAGSNSNVQIPRMSILPFSGNVGIGTKSPASKLEIIGLTADGSTKIIAGKDSNNVDVFSIDTEGNISTSGDHASSGYFDFGSMRMQWGIAVSGVVGAQTVTLPVPFADTSYVVTANITDTSTTWLYSIAISGKTTTSFVGNKVFGNYNETGVASQGFNWFAIGLKP